MRSDFLLIGPWSVKTHEWGAPIFSDLQSAAPHTKEQVFNVIGLSITSILESKFPAFFERNKKTNPSVQFIAIIPKDFSQEKILELHRKYLFFRVFDSFHHPDVETSFIQALNKSLQIQQDQNLLSLTEEQNRKLENLQTELEERIEKRAHSLSESRQKLFLANQRLGDLQKCVIASQRVRSIDELEAALQAILARPLQIGWIKIQNGITDAHTLKETLRLDPNFLAHRCYLYKEHTPIGEILFFRGHLTAFSKEEKEFLIRISEIISPVLLRLNKTKESEVLKRQWEVTFNSILDSIILIDDTYQVIQTNKKAAKGESQLKCFQLLFGRQSPCPLCTLGKNFRLHPSQDRFQTLEVSSHRLHLPTENRYGYVNVYHDISEKLELEKRILDSARLAELGIIGSSIAHELNNPLAGMLTYAQLMLMDLNKEHSMYSDIKEIEEAIKKCRDIVQDLLGFARQSENEDSSPISPYELCLKSKNIVDIRARSLGVPITIINELPTDFKMTGQWNLLLQAINHVLYSCWESICPLNSKQPRPGSWIRIELSRVLNTTKWNLLFIDNGNESLARAIGLSIPIAIQVFRDHGGTLEMGRDSNGNNTARIIFDRPVLPLP